MKPKYPNVEKVELVAHALGVLREQLIFVGGCAVDLLLTDSAAAPTRVTYDVDLVAQVTALAAYHQLENEFSKLGFKRDMSKDAPICRWRLGNLEVDLMPTETKVLGFANRWYPLVAKTARTVVLPSGAEIKLIAAPEFLATKFEAFLDRGKGDLLGSHDLEDIINVLDGRSEIVAEIAASEMELRHYLSEQCRALLGMKNFMDGLQGMVFPDESQTVRIQMIASQLEKITQFASGVVR